ncbi:MAG: hypothetical protein K0Q97_2103 [Bacillota bacterium]|jgi:4-hydroxybutyrate CoA-transferase|nr:hypothetical protein [Bacillota bacterium]
MKIGIKYCDGCNTFYDRKKVLDSLRKLFKEEIFEIANEIEFYNIILVFNGCKRSCTNYTSVKGDVKVFINSYADYSKAVDTIHIEKVNQLMKLNSMILFWY